MEKVILTNYVLDRSLNTFLDHMNTISIVIYGMQVYQNTYISKEYKNI